MNITKKLCRYCGSEIYVSAILCPICKSYQNKWRSIGIYIARITGFIALFASAIAFVASHVAVLMHNYQWKDNANVLYFRSGNFPSSFRIVIANTGDGQIYVRELRIWWKESVRSYAIDSEVDIDKIYSYDNLHLGELSAHGYQEFIANFTGHVNADVAYSSTQELAHEECFFSVFFSSNAGDIEHMNEYYKMYDRKLVSEPVNATLYFYSAHLRRFEKVKVPAVITFLRRRSEDKCMAIPID